MKNKERILEILMPVLAIIFIVTIAFLLSLNKKEKNESFESITFDDINELLESSDLSILSVLNTSYEDGEKQLDTFRNLTDEYYMSVKYVDYKDTIDDYDRFIEKNNIETETGILSLVLYNNEIIDVIDGSKSSEEIIDSLSKYIDFINRDFSEINVGEYLKLLEEKDSIKLVYVARPTCSYCKLMTPILKEVKNDNKLDIYYINSDNMTEVDYMTFVGTDESLLQGFGTPMLIITKDGTFIDVLNGYAPKENLIEFLEKNGII